MGSFRASRLPGTSAVNETSPKIGTLDDLLVSTPAHVLLAGLCVGGLLKTLPGFYYAR